MADFLITFSVDGTQAIRMMEEIGARATALEARLNALGRSASSSGGGPAGGILAGLGLSAPQLQAASSGLSSLGRQVAEMQSKRLARTQLNLPLSAGTLATEAVATRRYADELGKLSPAYDTLVNRSAALAEQSRTLAATTDDTTQSFARHTRRIFEAILVYEAFGAAIRGLGAATELVIDIDRESRRLEAVLSIDPEQGAQFIRGLGQIASETVTPVADLVSEADRMSSAFLNVADPIERAADALKLADAAGKFTTVTQRDLGEETSNLIAVMQQLNIPIDDFDDFLGKVVVAGGNASTVIAGLSDALQIVAQSAEASGTNIDGMLGLLSGFLVETGRTGGEVGNIFKTLFQRLGNLEVIDDVTELSGGLLRLRDSAGAVRDPLEVLLELNTLLDQGLITVTQHEDILGKIAPPLNPAAKADFILIADILRNIGPQVDKIAQADVSALDDLVQKINDALGPQFQKLIIDAQLAFTELFGPAILAGGQILIDVLRELGTVLSILPPEVLTVIGVALTLIATFKILSFTISGLTAILGIKGLGAIFGGAGGGQLALGLDATSRKAVIATGAMTALRTAMARVLPIAIALAAIELGSKLLSDAEQLDRLKAAGFSESDANESLGGAPAERKTQGVGSFGRFGSGGVVSDPNLTNVQAENLNRLAAALKTMDEQGNLTAKTQAAMKAAILDSNGSIRDQEIALDDILAAGSGVIGNTQGQTQAFGESSTAAREYADSLKNMTAEERLAADAATLATHLTEERASAIEQLNGQLADGSITLQEYNRSMDNVNEASDIASRLVAQFGDKLGVIPQLTEAARQGNEELVQALFNLINAGEGNIQSIARQANALIAYAQTHSAVAQSIFNTPIVIRTIILPPETSMGGFREGTDEFGAPSGSGVRSVNLFDPTAAMSNITNQLSRDLERMLGGLGRTLVGGLQRAGSLSSGSTGGGGSRTKTKPPPRPPATVFDIEDLPPRLISRMIAIATRLRNRIPGERADSRDDRVALVRNARFLQTVRGIDDRLLRLALERLTKGIERQNELEEARAQRDNIMRNLVVNSGPLSALVSQPTAFGVGGSLAAGTGLNFNPAKGNFVINVPVQLKGLQPAALQQLIYNIISKAIRDALRL